MTEAEWQAAPDLQRLLKHQRQARRARKLRLFACACARRALDRTPFDLLNRAIETSERFAEADTHAAELDSIYREGMQAWGEANMAWSVLVMTGMAVAMPDAGSAAQHSSNHVPGVIVPSGTASRRMLLRRERDVQVLLFHDIFGNPFRPVAFSPEWRTDTAIALVSQMYESRDFGAMPILADALQDAGCTNDDILSHCRGDGPHVRGCWVVDLVLGKN